MTKANKIQYMGSHWGEKIRSYLQSPYPVAYQRWKVVLISSLVVFLILLVLQPFGISGIRQHKFWILVGFMGVTAVSLSIPMYVLATGVYLALSPSTISLVMFSVLSAYSRLSKLVLLIIRL